MASKDYLFVNKDSRSPSLSRNTGNEAPLASRVNKHVQQQRFWKPSGPRRSWYRPFVRSDSSSSAPSSARSETPILESTTSARTRISSDRQSPKLPTRSTLARISHFDTKQGPRASSQELVSSGDDSRLATGRWPLPSGLLTLIAEPGNAVDAFNTIVVPLTPILAEVIQRQMKWAIAASVTDYTVQEGVKRVFSVVLQNKMRATAFLAMATAQQKEVNALVFPRDQSPELYSYRATKMIREYIENHQGVLPSYTLVDIFRLAMCEWISGNHDAARIHLAYASKLWSNFEPRDSVDHHVQEVCSSEDIFLAIDIDEKPLLALDWLPGLSLDQQPSPSGSQLLSNNSDNRPNAASEATDSETKDDTSQLECDLRLTGSSLVEILHFCTVSLRLVPGSIDRDIGSALKGSLWTVKRRLHATLHRLQSLDLPTPSTDDCIRRSLIIVLLLASTTPERRVARTNTGKLAERLKTSLQNLEISKNSEDVRTPSAATRAQFQDSGLWLWMYTAGFAAAREAPSHDCIKEWFLKRALPLATRICGPRASLNDIQVILSGYLYFNYALGEAVEALSAAIASYAA